MIFMQYAMIGVALISIASAMIGTYIVTRRMVFISGGITHASFGGLGLGYYLGISPMLMATVFAIAGALGVDHLSKKGARRDTAIAVIWALGMALGILFIFLTPGYVPDLNTFLFGNVLTISPSDLIIFAVLCGALVLFHLIFYNLILTVSFDEDFARTRNLPVSRLNMIMTIFVGVTIVMTIRMVGIMLLMSLVSLPQMVSEKLTKRYLPMMMLSIAVSLAGCIGGLWCAYFINVPASAAIVILLVIIYCAVLPIKSFKRSKV